jgi:hypothetical protein
MKRKPIQAMQGNLPFVQRQVFAGCSIAGLDIILIDSIKMLEENLIFRISYHFNRIKPLL